MYYYDLNIFGVIHSFLVKGNPNDHLWYFYMLLGLSLVTPSLSLCLIGVVFTVLFLQIPTTRGTFEYVTFKSYPDYFVFTLRRLLRFGILLFKS